MSNYIYEEAANLLPNQIAFTIYTQSVTNDPEGSGIGYYSEVSTNYGVYVSPLNNYLKTTIFTFSVNSQEYNVYVDVIGDSWSSSMNLFAIKAVTSTDFSGLSSATVQNITHNTQMHFPVSYISTSMCSFNFRRSSMEYLINITKDPTYDESVRDIPIKFLVTFN